MLSLAAPRYLVVADQTATSPELRTCLTVLAERDPDAEFTLIVPATPVTALLTWDEGRTIEVAGRRAGAAAAFLRAAGIPLVATMIGDGDPYTAVADALLRDPRYTTIIVSTLPPGMSRWLRLDLPARLRRRHPKLRVVHVAARTPSEEPTPSTAMPVT